MAIEDIWLANLRALVDEIAPGDNKKRGLKRPAFREIATRAAISEEYVYQLYNGKSKKAVVGGDMAKSIARAFANGRDLSWFDNPARSAPEVRPAHSQHGWPFESIISLAEYLALPADEQGAIKTRLRDEVAAVRARLEAGASQIATTSGKRRRA